MNALKQLIAVEKWTCLLALLVMVGAFVLYGFHIAFSVSLGAGLMVGNAYALRRIGHRIFLTFKKPGAAVLLFNLKMVALIAVVYAVIRFLHINVVAFVVGISVFPLAVVAVAIQHAIHEAPRPSDESDSMSSPDEETHE